MREDLKKNLLETEVPLTDNEILTIANSMATLWNNNTDYMILPSYENKVITVEEVDFKGLYTLYSTYTPQEFIQEWLSSILVDYHTYEYHYITKEQLEILEQFN